MKYNAKNICLNLSTNLQHGQFYLLISLIAAATFSSCGNGREKTTPTIQDITESVYASGTIKAVGQYDVFAPTSGILKQTLVLAGDTINTETSLFIIDNTVSALNAENARIAADLLKDKTGPNSNTLRDLEARLSMAKDKMENDSLLYSRQQNLWNQQAGSKMELEKRELGFKASKTEYESIRLQFEQTKSELEKGYQQALNNLKISQKQTDDFIVKSKIKGTVYSILREPGEWVSIQTPIAIIGETGKFEIELQVDEFDIVQVKPEQQVFITMDSYRGQVFEAIVKRVEPYMNPRTRTFPVYAEFLKRPEVVYPNFSVEGNILIAKKEQAITIPATYLVGSNKVILSTDDTVNVVTGIKNLQWVEIIEGLDRNSEVFMPK